jgi:type II secretory pathway component PulK
VLLAVLVVVTVLTLAAYRFSESIASEALAAESYARSLQAQALAESGIHYAMALLADPASFSLDGNPYDNSTIFKDVLVQDSDQLRRRGRFSIVTPEVPDNASTSTQSYRFGLLDESSKINLNALMKLDSKGQMAHDILMKLPNMTEDIANAILDWLDTDEEPRINGAEDEYYPMLTPPYHCKNGPLDSLEELLYVKGVTWQLLFGNDSKRNGSLDPDVADGSGALDQGWSRYLTIYSREQDLDSSGQPRININDSDLPSLLDNLTAVVGEDLATYIIAYRLYGPASASTGGNPPKPQNNNTPKPQNNNTPKPSGNTTPTTSGATGNAGGSQRLERSNLGDLQQSGRKLQTIKSLYDLINQPVSIPSSTPKTPATQYPSPLTDTNSIREYLPLLLDKVTTRTDKELPGRVNINTAPEAVLKAFLTVAAKLEESQVQAIIDGRPSLSLTDAPDPIFQTPAWLMTEANITKDTMKNLEKYITTRGQAYRLQSVGYFDGGGPSVRLEAVIDTNAGRPRIVYWRNLVDLGKGYDFPSGQQPPGSDQPPAPSIPQPGTGSQ